MFSFIRLYQHIQIISVWRTPFQRIDELKGKRVFRHLKIRQSIVLKIITVVYLPWFNSKPKYIITSNRYNLELFELDAFYFFKGLLKTFSSSLW